MNQAVATTSNVTFNSISLTKASLSSDTWGASVGTSGQSFQITLTSIPTIAAATDGIVTRTEIPSTVGNVSVTATSVILASSTSELSVYPFRAANEQFQFHIANEGSSIFNAGSAVFNFTIF